MKRFLFLLVFLALFQATAHAATYNILGTGGNDHIVVSQFHSIYATIGGNLVLNLPNSECESDTILYIAGYGGNDTIEVNFPPSCDVTCRIFGGDGTDNITIAGCGDVIAHGNGGPDHFYLGNSHQYFSGIVYGDDQNDEFNDYFLQYAVLYGGDGNDAFSGKIRTLAVLYGGEDEDYFFGGPSESEGQGVYVSNDDSGLPFSGDTYFDFFHYKTIYCDGADWLMSGAFVENVVGDCD